MKKVIGILGVTVFAMAMFMNTNTISNNSDLNLASLLAINNANANSEDTAGIKCYCTSYTGFCRTNGMSRSNCANFSGNGDCSAYNSNCAKVG